MKQKRTWIVGIVLLIGFVGGSLFGVQGNSLAQVAGMEVYLPLVLRPAVPTVTPTVGATPLSPTPTVGVTPIGPTPTVVKHEGTLIIDHRSVALYDRIPAQYLRAAENLRILYQDRSVGMNISDGLTCLAAASWADSLSHCRRDYIDSSLTESKTFTPSDLVIPSAILFPGGNNRDNIQVILRESTWEDDLRGFITAFPGYAGSKDMITFQHNYLHVQSGSTIDEVYFDPNYNGTNIVDLAALEDQYPNKTFIYWTSSLSRLIGTADSQSFNDQMRTWAAQEGKILFDVADIESYTPENQPCRNDQGYEILCKRYTTETNGGHLGSVSAGKIRIAKAMWVMLAQIAGWNP